MNKIKKNHSKDNSNDELYRFFVDESGYALWAYSINEEFTKGGSISQLINVIKNATLVDCNKAKYSSYGFTSKEEILGKKFNELLAISDESFETYINNFVENNYETKKLNLKEKTANGLELVIEVSAKAHFDENDKFKMITGSFIDRTELYNVKQELINTNIILDEQNKMLSDKIEISENYKNKYIEEHELYKSLFFNSPSPKFIINPINYRIIEINQSALELFEVENKNKLRLLDLIDSSNYGTLKDYLQGHNGNNQTTYKGLTKSTKKDLYLNIQSKRLNYKGNSVLILQMTDLTKLYERNTIEKELKTKLSSMTSNLIETQSNYKLLIDESPYGIIIHQDNKVVYVNKICQNLLFINNTNDIIGKNYLDFIDVKYKSIEQERTKQVILNNEHTEQIRYELNKFNGDKFYSEVITFPTEYQGKQAVQILFNDISNQIEFQNNLIESEERYRILFESSKNLLIICNINGDILDVNKVSLQKFKYDFNEIKKLNLFNLLVQDTFSFLENPFDKIENEDGFEGNCFAKTSLGEEFITTAYFKKIKLDSKDCIFVSIRDITIEENTKNKIKESRKESNDIIENLALPVSISNFQTGNIIYFSRKFKEIFGDKVETPDFNSFELYKDPDDARRLRELFINTNRVLNFEVELINKDKKCIVGLLSSTKINFRGEEALLSSFIDITKRKRFESELQNRDRLLEELSDISKIGGWEYVIADDILTWTNQTYLIHNKKLGSPIIAEEAIDFYHPDDRETINNVFHDLMNYGKSYDIELRIRPVDKDYLWIRTIGHAVYENGIIKRVNGTIQDINERKKNEIRIKDYSYSLSLAAKAANFGIWDWNIVENKLTWDSKMWEIFELEPREITDIHFWKEFTYLDDWMKIRNMMIRSFNKIEDFESEFRIITKSKKLKYIQSFAYIEFENDKAIRMIGVNWDMTKEKLADIQLEESLKKFETLYNNSPVMLYSFDRKGLIVSVSNFWLKSLGYDRNEVVGKKTTDFLSQKSKKYAEEFVLPKFFKNGSVSYINYELVKKNGGLVEVEFSAISERDEEGNLIRSLAVMIDVSERNLALKESENKTKRLIEFRKALDIAAFVIFTDINGHIKYTNNNFNKLINKTQNNLLNMNLIDLIDLKESNIEQNVIVKSMKSSKIWQGELKLKNIENVWLQTTAIPIYDEITNSDEILIISFEITRLITAENKLIQLNKNLEDRVNERTLDLVNLNKDKDNILSMVSHDLKNPLTGIILASDIIKIHSEKNNETKIFEVAEKIAKTSYKMIDIIKNLLELNAVESGKISTHFTYINLPQVLENIVNDAKINSDNKSQHIHFISKSEEYAVYTDKKLMIQIMDNLISNSIKFSHKNKNIWIELIEEKDNYSVIVKDEGVGISKDDLPKLFDKYSKLNSKPTDGEDSTGLGLSIVKQLVELLNGKIEVESKVNKGTQFTLNFNRHQVNI